MRFWLAPCGNAHDMAWHGMDLVRLSDFEMFIFIRDTEYHDVYIIYINKWDHCAKSIETDIAVLFYSNWISLL